MEIIRARKTKLSMDLAPLIDVVFQLLVFFMLTSVFVNPSMKIVLPRAGGGETDNMEHITVSISEDGRVAVNDRPSSLDSLINDLEDVLAGGPIPVRIRGDKDMPYKYFVRAMDAARRAGARQVHIVHEK
jgi:biopolymer transport protein ExbD